MDKIIMQGKAQDIHLAETLRENFIRAYNEEKEFQALLDDLGDNTADRLIHRLKTEESIDLFRDYVALKQIAQNVIEKGNRKVFLEVCKVDVARAWINDNGKYTGLAFEALYHIFRREQALIPLIKTR